MVEQADAAFRGRACPAIQWRAAVVALALVSVSVSALAQGSVEPAGASASSPVQGTSKPRAGATQLAQVEITGSRLPAAEAANLQDVRIYPRDVIERSGQATLSEFLATRPEVSLSTPENATAATTVRLRGAIFGSPLVLINGRRAQATTGFAAVFSFYDLNTIPLSLVERIEVLPTGSSAIYGGDALAGVVNIILRTGGEAAEIGAGYQGAKNTDTKTVWAGGQWTFGDLNVSVMGNYSERSSLYGRDRAITASPDYRPVGGPNLGNQFFGSPANVSSVSGNLPGLNSSFAAVPKGSSGIGLTPADFAATAGTLNTGSFTQYQALVPALRSTGAFLSASYRLAPRLEAFVELLATKYDLANSPAPPSLQLASVPASNPFNPFGTTVRVSGVVQGAENLAQSPVEENLLRPVLGLRGTFRDWTWEVSALESRDHGSTVTTGQPNNAALTAALASSDPANALNPFVDGPMGSRSLLSSIYSVASVTNFKADSKIVNGFVRGAPVQLPAGALTAVFGGEHEDATFERGSPQASRNVNALFTELRAPILSAIDRTGGSRDLLTVQGAARYDDYSDFGSKTTWQAGFEARPQQSLLLRGTHATAFKPPTLYNLSAPPQSFPTAVNDPRRNGETVIVPSTFGGNQTLQPTTSASSTLGFVWSPPEVRDLNVSLTGWWLRIEDPINFPISSQFLVDNEASFPGRVTRAPAAPGAVGPITSVDRTYMNGGLTHQSGIDVAADWRVRTSAGVWKPALAATYMTKFEGAITPGAAPTERLSVASQDGVFAPRWKGIASVGWTPGPAIDLAVAGRYIGSYTDYTPPRKIGNIWYFDASVAVDVERAFGMARGALGHPTLLINGTNLADKLPVYSTFFRGYDVFNYDLVGRSIFVRLKFQT